MNARIIVKIESEYYLLKEGTSPEQALAFFDGMKPVNCDKYSGSRTVQYRDPDIELIVADLDKMIVLKPREEKHAAEPLDKPAPAHADAEEAL